MQSVLVRLFLHGLIAVAPVNSHDTATVPLSQGVNRMVALLVDGRQLPSDALPIEKKCFASHSPRLLVSATPSACFDAKCTQTKDHNVTLCECTAFKKEIWLRPDLDLPKLALSSKLTIDFPARAADAKAFDNVPNLSNFGLELDPKFLSGSAAGLLGRMHFPVGTLTACSLAARDDQGVSNVHAFNFQASSTTGSTIGSQVIPQQLEVQVPFASGSPVSLHIANLDGSDPFDLPLTPIPDEQACGDHPCIEIMLSDARPELLAGDPCDDGNGYDFAFFYELTKNPPAWRDRLIPRVQANRAQPSAPLAVNECSHGPGKGILGRPICAVAAFAKP